MQAGNDGRVEELLCPFGDRLRVLARQDPLLREAQLARDAEHRRLGNRVGERCSGRERSLRLDGEHDEIRTAHGVLVCGAGRADLGGFDGRALRVA